MSTLPRKEGSPISPHGEVGEEDRSQGRQRWDPTVSGSPQGIAWETAPAGGSLVRSAQEGQARKGEGQSEASSEAGRDQPITEAKPLEPAEPIRAPTAVELTALM